MKYFLKSEGKSELFPALSKRVDYFKNQEEGVNEMCEWSERILQEGRKEGRIEGLEIAKRILKAYAGGASAAEIAGAEQLSEAEVRGLLEA